MKQGVSIGQRPFLCGMPDQAHRPRAQRIAMIFAGTTGLPISERLKRVHAAAPHATEDDIKRVLKTQHEIAQLDAIDAAVEAAAVQKMAHVLDRAQEISGNRNMNTGEAIAFLAELAEGGSAEAKELIESINDPFLGDD